MPPWVPPCPAALTASAVLEALGVVLVRGVPMAAVTVPAGILAATIPPHQPATPAPEWRARERRTRQRAEGRARRQATERADREGRDLRSNALAVSLGGMVASWRIGELVVPPDGQLDWPGC